MSTVNTNVKMPFLVLVLFLTIVFTTGGSSRGDAIQTVYLQPISLVFFGYALISMRVEHIRANRSLFWFVTAIVALTIVHLIPFTVSLILKGPETAYSNYQHGTTAVDAVAPLHPSTFSFRKSWDALQTLVVPLTVILLGVQIDRKEKYLLLPVFIILATISGLVGLLQSIGEPNGVLYFYEVTNNGSAVGLFANRNHAATLLACLFPMLSLYASTTKNPVDEKRTQKLLAAVLGIIAIPLILVTGSRSGFLLALIALALSALLYKRTSKIASLREANFTLGNYKEILFGLVIVFGLGIVTVYYSRAEAIERLLGEASGESRGDFVIVSYNIFLAYFPWGIGPGSFVEAYQLAEPQKLLDPSYLNRAHNDWVETVVAFGFPGIIILAGSLVGYGRQTYNFWLKSDVSRRSTNFGRMASVIIAIIGLASISDYPLRTPMMMAFAAVLTMWIWNSEDSQFGSKN